MPRSPWRRTEPRRAEKDDKGQEGRLIVVSLRSPSPDPPAVQSYNARPAATLGSLYVALCVIEPEGRSNMTRREDLIRDVFSFLTTEEN